MDESEFMRFMLSECERVNKEQRSESESLSDVERTRLCISLEHSRTVRSLYDSMLFFLDEAKWRELD